MDLVPFCPMADTRTFPPQAYTREVLAQAYEWLKTQPPSIKELATSADDLVSLFLHSRRRVTHFDPPAKQIAGYDSAPVSSQSFKSDLKNLAQGLKQFEGAQSQPSQKPPQPDAPASPSAQSMPPSVEPVDPRASNSSASTGAKPTSAGPQPGATAPRSVPQPTPEPRPTSASSVGFHIKLDRKSLELAKEVQIKFNLSTETEAIRLLLVLGFERAKDLFPKS